MARGWPIDMSWVPLDYKVRFFNDRNTPKYN